MACGHVNDEIESLGEAWCARRELKALAGLLPSWLANNGLTDGWVALAEALHHVSTYRDLPPQEREALKQMWVEVPAAVQNR